LLSIAFELETGSFTLARNRGTSLPLLALEFSRLKAKHSQRPNSSLMELSLDGLIVKDREDNSNKYKNVISPKENKDNPKTQWLHLLYEDRPLDGHADHQLSLTMQPLEIVWCKGVVLRLMQFLQSGLGSNENMVALRNPAGNKFDELNRAL